MNDKSLRQEISDENELHSRNESPLDPGVYTDEIPSTSSPLSFYSSSSSDNSASNANYPCILPLQGDKKMSVDSSCSLANIWAIFFRGALECLSFSFLFILPALIAYTLTDASWYDFTVIRWNDRFQVLTPVMEFFRITVHLSAIYSAWVMIDVATKIVPLLIRRSWHLLKQPIPNTIKTTLAGWKASRVTINLALFGFTALLITDILVFGSSKLVSSAATLTSKTISGLSQAWQWVERALVAVMTLSIMVLGQKVLMQCITSSYRKQALAPRILASNFKFRVLTRLFRQTNLGEADARRSIAREQAREALHPADEDFVEISKDMVGIRLTSAERASALAAALWGRICPISRNYLVLEDFHSFFTVDDCPEAFAVFDLNGTGIINATTWIQSVTEIWVERRNLTSSVRMSDATLGTLESFINAVLFSCWALSVLGCISPSGYTFLTSAAGFLFGFGFLFKDSCERIFKSFIFVLVEHPFDIGDVVIIDKVRYSVVKMELFQTTFRRMTDSAITYIPNNTLVAKYIYNEQRSGITTESLLVTLPSHTSLTVLGALQANLNTFLSESFDSYTGSLKIQPVEVQESQMNIRVECKFQDSESVENEVKITRKDALSFKIQTYLKDNKILN